MVFEIQGFKLKNENNDNDDKKNWRNGFCHISHFHGPIHTKFWVYIHIDLDYHPMMLKVESERIFECTGIMDQDLVHPYIQITRVDSKASLTASVIMMLGLIKSSDCSSYHW